MGGGVIAVVLCEPGGGVAAFLCRMGEGIAPDFGVFGEQVVPCVLECLIVPVLVRQPDGFGAHHARVRLVVAGIPQRVRHVGGEFPVLVAEGTSVQTLVMNVNAKEKQDTPMRTILKNKDVRKAIALAIDQESIIDSVLNGEGSPASAGLMLTNQTELYNPEADILSGDYEARVAQANEILDGIYPEKDGKGYRLADGKRIHFDILANPGELELVSYLQSQFARIGIEVEYKAEGSTAEDTYLFDGDFDMTFQATILNIANIDIMYRSHFVQVDDRSSNYGRLMDEELTAMIEQMRTSLNLNTKYELVKQIQMRLAESYYKVPVYASNVISVVRKDRFTGYVAGPGETAFNLDTLEVLQKVV